MEDKEIIKALECCADIEGTRCYECPFRKHNDCETRLATSITDLINRLQAEIEYFKKEHIEIDNFARNICKERLLQGKAIADFDSLRKYVEMQIAEAVKEFAERLKEKAFTHEIPFEANEDKYIKLVAVKDIDNLVKKWWVRVDVLSML